MSDDRYEVVPEYMANAFRQIDRHYKQRKNTKGKVELTDYGNVIDFREVPGNCSDNLDAGRLIIVANRKGGFNGKTKWEWNVQNGFNKDWVFEPSLNKPVSGDGCPPKKIDKVPEGNLEDQNQNNNHNFQNKKKNNKIQYTRPFHKYRPDTTQICGSSSSQVYAIDNVPGLFVISRVLHYSSQIVWALRCFLTYEKDYTNLYNLHFTLPEKGVKEGLETLPDQTDLPEELQVHNVEDIQELFFKSCKKAKGMGFFDSKLGPSSSPIETCSFCALVHTGQLSTHSHYRTKCGHIPYSMPTSNQIHPYSPPKPPLDPPQSTPSSLPLTPQSIQPINPTETPHSVPQKQTPSTPPPQCDLTSLKRLRWASLGYHYDWTDREYSDDNKSPFPPELLKISQLVIQPLVDHGLVTPLIPEAGIINYYPTGTRMGAHIDDAELAVQCPIVSFSVGCTAVFAIGNKGRKDEPVQLFLRSGDCLVQDGVSRLAFHSVPRIVEDSAPLEALYTASNALLDEYYRFKNAQGVGGVNGGTNEQNNGEETADVEVLEENDRKSINSEEADEISNFEEPATASYVPIDTFTHFIELINEIEPFLAKYQLSIEEILTFLLHVLSQYRINFNTRQVQDPKLGASLAEVRQKFPIDAVKKGVYEGLVEGK
jgi:DNA alkylation damage repair protein AlkB